MHSSNSEIHASLITVPSFYGSGNSTTTHCCVSAPPPMLVPLPVTLSLPPSVSLCDMLLAGVFAEWEARRKKKDMEEVVAVSSIACFSHLAGTTCLSSCSSDHLAQTLPLACWASWPPTTNTNQCLLGRTHTCTPTLAHTRSLLVLGADATYIPSQRTMWLVRVCRLGVSASDCPPMHTGCETPIIKDLNAAAVLTTPHTLFTHPTSSII